MPAWKNSDRNTAISIKVQKVLVKRSAFPQLASNLVEPLVTFYGLLHTKITLKIVAQALMTQAATETPGLDKKNFQILQKI